MSGGEGVNNEHTGAVEGNVFQVGTMHGDFMLQRDVPADESLAKDLAGVVGIRSRKEEEHWRIDDPDPLRVRWHAAEKDLFDRWENIHGDLEHHDPVPLSGQFTTIRETFQATGSQRLVILGRAGAGKTVLAHRLILDLLAHRHPRGSVPVLFSLNDWNPTATGLRDWMIDRLVRDHPFLEQCDATGIRRAKMLVDRNWILPVLDGLDELVEQHRSEAIRQISQVQVPLAITSRSYEYARATRAVNAVGKAAAIEIEDLTLEQAARYLCSSTGPPRAAEWEAVFEQLHTAPEQVASRNLRPVLTTPLMVMLARTLYNDTDEHAPGELLDTARFSTRPDLERHLLSGYVSTLYDPRRPQRTSAARLPWDLDQVRHWLGHLAIRLQARDTHDLTWWQLPALLPRRTRIVVTTVIYGLAVGLPIGLVNGLASALLGGFVDGLAYGFLDGLVRGLLVGLVTGVPGGFAVGVLNEAAFVRGRSGRKPERLRPYWLRRGRQRQRSKRAYLTRAASEFTSGITAGVVVAIVGGFVAGLAYGIPVGLGFGLVVGLAFGLVIGTVNVVVSMLGEGHDPHDSDPWQLLITDRTVTLIRAIPAGLVVIPIGFVSYVENPVLSTIAGLTLGLLVGLLRLTISAWGGWLLFVRLWFPLTGRLPWRPQRFLEDAYDRGILRQAGTAYQFRHAELRDHLADHLNKRTKRRITAS